MSLNKVMLIGNVGRDPDVRYLEGNSKVATFTLATSEKVRNRTTGEVSENTEWHNLVAWRGQADYAENYIRKGSQLFVEGRLRTRSYVDSTGAKRSVTEIVVDNFQLLGRREGTPAPLAVGTAAQTPRPSFQTPAQTSAQPAPQPFAQPQSGAAQQQAFSAPAASPQPAVPEEDGPADDLPF